MNSQCSIDGCERPTRKREWCELHYRRWRKHGDPNYLLIRPTATERFWASIDKQGPIIRTELGPCWVWTKRTSDSGYGQIRVAGRDVAANRFSLELHSGESPDDLFALHHCDNRACVRPSHLYWGTQSENMIDMFTRGRVSRRGVHNGRALVTQEIADEIRSRYIPKVVYLKDLAVEYGINFRTVWRIVKYETWRG